MVKINTTSFSPPSNASNNLRGAVYFGQDGCEHQAFMQPIRIIHGTDLDAGTVAIQIGEACVQFSSITALLERLTGQAGDGVAVRLAG